MGLGRDPKLAHALIKNILNDRVSHLHLLRLKNLVWDKVHDTEQRFTSFTGLKNYFGQYGHLSYKEFTEREKHASTEASDLAVYSVSRQRKKEGKQSR